MKKKHYFIAGSAVLVMVAAALFFLIRPEGEDSQTGLQHERAAVRTAREDPGRREETARLREYERAVVYLYFTDRDTSHLTAEPRTLFKPADPAEFGRYIMDALIKGPANELMRTIPPETVVNALYITEEGTAYVDLSEAVSDRHPGGIRLEMMTVYSIVNSLALNIPEVDAVKLLIAGRESDTLAGHIDIRFSFRANMLIVR